MSLPSLYLRMLCLFNTYSQPTLPYRIPGVDANDVLYAAEPEYSDSLNQITAKLLSGTAPAPASFAHVLHLSHAPNHSPAMHPRGSQSSLVH